MRSVAVRAWLALIFCGAAAVLPGWSQSEPACTLGMFPYLGTGTMSKTGAPYTVTIRETYEQKLADGNSIHASVVLHQARNTAGVVRVEMPQRCLLGEDGTPQLQSLILVSDHAAKTTLSWQEGPETFDHVARLSHQRTAPVKDLTEEDKAAQRLRSALRAKAERTQEELKTEDLGVRMIQGVSAHGHRKTMNIPAGAEGNALPLQVIMEDWVSNDLGPTLMSIRDDPRSGKMTREVEDLSLSEPDPLLFQPPAGYTLKENLPQN